MYESRTLLQNHPYIMRQGLKKKPAGLLVAEPVETTSAEDLYRKARSGARILFFDFQLKPKTATSLPVSIILKST